MTFKIIENNTEIECNIISTFTDEGNNINYIIYTDGSRNSDGELDVYASRYTIEDNNYILKEIENDYEWNLIDNMLESKYKELGE